MIELDELAGIDVGKLIVGAMHEDDEGGSAS
jgi:hypothetical protein